MDPSEIIAEYYPQLYRSSFLLTGNKAAAEDLAQETILRALDAWPKFRGESSRKTWLYAILLNVHRSSVRSERRHWDRIVRWFQWNRRSQASISPETRSLQQEWCGSLWHAVSQLPTSQQQTIMLRFHGELSYEEIAQTMNCPIGTVKSRLNAGLSKLAEDPVLQDLREFATELW